MIDLGVFSQSNKISNLYTTDLLNSWLTDLNSLQSPFHVHIQDILRYSLIGRGSHSSLLHYNILQMFQKKLVHPIDSVFLLELVTHFDSSNPKATQKYLQIVIVAIQNGCVKNLNQKFSKTLLDRFPEDLILRSILNVA